MLPPFNRNPIPYYKQKERTNRFLADTFSLFLLSDIFYKGFISLEYFLPQKNVHDEHQAKADE